MKKFVLAFVWAFLSGPVWAQSSSGNQGEQVIPQTLNVRVEQAEPFRTEKEDKPALVAILTGPFGGGIAGALAAGAGVLIAHLTGRSTLRQKSNEAEMKEIQERLNSFYGPFKIRSVENKLIANEFRQKQGGSDFRTLIALLDPQWKTSLSNADQNLLKKMIDNGVTLRGLIQEKSGHVYGPLMPRLAEAATHFTMLEMAYNDQLDNTPPRFSTYVYPRELDEKIDEEIEYLNARLDLLLRYPGKQHPSGRYQQTESAPSNAYIVAGLVAVGLLMLPTAWSLGGQSLLTMPFGLTSAITAGATAILSAALWMRAARNSDDKAANYAAAGMSGATAIFTIAAIALPPELAVQQPWISSNWSQVGYAFGMTLTAATVFSAWRRR
ncbi:hypothetical protein [Ensifer sesbaniae]|uniref:hypothetical protein n=1 Tax=Ensifer sesbaniae TaxID=1214071 RepID=UPI00156A37FD|nr:hypothetical protein [Ensifer sesbaniae]NRQ17681.1 hypothetical protein [Ensifer sesbaniae]